jgi:general secretion pathway protein K
MTSRSPPGRRRSRDGGYALLVAVTAMAAFAYVAFQVLAANQGGMSLVAGRVEQAKLAAAADAGVNMAIHGLAEDDRTLRWSIDGRTRNVDFEGTDLTIVVEDERGKAPLASLNDSQARALFARAGASGERLDALVKEFRDWQTEDVTPGVERDLSGERPIRHGPFATVEELAGLKDMDPVLLSRIAPATTVFFEESGPFEPKHASALARAAMTADAASPNGADADAAAMETEMSNERPAEEIASPDSLIGRTLTVRVTARDRDGGRIVRSAIVELTGNNANQ